MRTFKIDNNKNLVNKITINAEFEFISQTGVAFYNAIFDYSNIFSSDCIYPHLIISATMLDYSVYQYIFDLWNFESYFATITYIHSMHNDNADNSYHIDFVNGNNIQISYYQNGAKTEIDSSIFHNVSSFDLYY